MTLFRSGMIAIVVGEDGMEHVSAVVDCHCCQCADSLVTRLFGFSILSVSHYYDVRTQKNQ